MTREHRIKRRRIGMKRLPHVWYPIPMAIGSGANGQRRRRNSPAPQFCPKAGDNRSRTKEKANAEAPKAEEFSKLSGKEQTLIDQQLCVKACFRNNGDERR